MNGRAVDWEGEAPAEPRPTFRSATAGGIAGPYLMPPVVAEVKLA
jgi:hypothetical protein